MQFGQEKRIFFVTCWVKCPSLARNPKKMLVQYASTLALALSCPLLIMLPNESSVQNPGCVQILGTEADVEFTFLKSPEG